MKRAEIKERLYQYFDTFSFKSGIYTIKRSYYWGISKTGETLSEKVTKTIPNANIIDYGNHWHAFVGGAKTGGPQDSYLWVKFTVKD